MSRIPTLDGWRGVAIALVLFDHLQDALLRHYMRPWTQTGQHGVTIFFVLSGFLITSKLTEGSIKLKDFYLRRFFRLMPAAWTFLAFLFFFGHLFHIHWISLSQIAACVFFYGNFYGVSGRHGHFWSLSLEEQFYLVWPFILLHAGPKRSRWIAASCAIGCAIYRMMFWEHYDHNVLNGQTQVRADALLVGCLLALILVEEHNRQLIGRWSKRLIIPAVAAVLACIAYFHWLPPLTESVAIASLIAATTLNPRLPISRFLSYAPIVWLGTVSYSVYLWQELFMGHWTGWGAVLVLGVSMPLFSLGSYYLIELPATGLGHRITSPRINEKEEEDTKSDVRSLTSLV